MNRTKQQLKQIIDGIDDKSNDETYQDINFLLNKLRAQFQVKYKVLRGKAEIGKLVRQIQLIMKDIGDSYDNIEPDGTILIRDPETLMPIVKIYNRQNAKYYTMPIRVYYKD